MFTLACTAQQTLNETQLTTFEGLGATYFGIPTFGGITPSFSTQVVRPGDEAYLSIILRNNAEGEQAQDIIMSLDNVDPFKIVECGEPHEPTEIRTEASECITWFDTKSYPYRTFRIPVMAPNEETEIIYVLKSPTKEQIANVYYEQEIFYNLQYRYKTNMFQVLLGLSQDEYSTRLTTGDAIAGSQSVTAGPIKITPKTTTPVIYSLGSPKSFSIEFQISNNGEGVLQPQSNLNLTLTYPSNVVLSETQASDDKWINLAKCSTTNNKACQWYIDEYEGENMERTLYLEIPSTELVSTRTIVVSFNLQQTNTPIVSIPFIAKIEYSYINSGSAKIGVSPIK